MTLICIGALLSGCDALTINTYCDIAQPMPLATEGTVEWLIKNDRSLLTDVIVHNETHARVCN